MSCAEVQQQLREAAQPAEELSGSAGSHLLECSTCQSYQQELTVLGGVLRGMAPPELPDGFELGLRRRLLAEAKQKRAAAAPRPRLRLVAAAAVLLLVLSGGVIWWSLSSGPAEVSYHRIHLATKTMTPQEALFDLRLPDGVEVAPGVQEVFGRGRVVRWRADLRPGLNSFDLPVQVHGVAGPLHAEVRIGGRTLRATIHLGQPDNRQTSQARQEIGRLALLMVAHRQEGAR